MNISTNDLCCGCRACEQICGKKAITFKQDKEGFYYPEVDLKKCTDCGVCTTVCPELHTEKSLNPQGTAFAAQSKNFNVLESSSSGGIFSLFAEDILSKGGVVVGAELTKDLIVKHIVIDDIKDLYRLRGSKYTQSDTTGIYQDVKQILQSGKLVFFTGTPCQVSALKLFLRKEYENLICGDLVCHGVPSVTMFHRLIDYIEKDHKTRVVDYRFRDKTLTGWSRVSACKIEKAGKSKVLYYDKNMRAFFKAFLAGHILRMDCYKCPFTRPQRTGDFTMADFWSLNATNPRFPRQHRGVSMILVNTHKGQKAFDAIKDKMNVEPSNLQIILDGRNYQLKQPTELCEERKNVFDLFFNNPEEFVKRYIKEDISRDRQRFYITAIKEYIKKLIHFHGQY